MLPGGIGAAEAGMTGMFAKLAGLSWSLSVALTFVIRLSEPTTPQGREALRLRHALESATPESHAEYEARYGRVFRWEEGSYDEG